MCQQKPIVEYCKKHSIVVQAYCPILRGKMNDPTITAIAEKVRSPLLPLSHTHRRLMRHSTPVGQRRSSYAGLSRTGTSALPRTYHGANSAPHSFVPLPKSATPVRIHANAALYDFELDDADMTALDALDHGKDGAVSWNPVDQP